MNYPAPPSGVSPETADAIAQWVNLLVDARVNEHLGPLSAAIDGVKLTVGVGITQATAACVRAVQDQFANLKAELDEFRRQQAEGDEWKYGGDDEGQE
jgi:hypothetical protein